MSAIAHLTPPKRINFSARTANELQSLVIIHTATGDDLRSTNSLARQALDELARRAGGA